MAPVFFAKEFENKNLSNHIIFICDHASNHIPKKYKKLGISDSDLASHIAFDIGAKNFTINLAKKLKQSYFLSNFSRLLIDPNRKEIDRELIPVNSFGVNIPKNLNISNDEREYRINLFYENYPRYHNERTYNAVDEYFKIAKKNTVSLTQLSQAFVNSRDFVTSNIIGATTMSQLKENVESINISLTEEVINEINLVHEKIPNPAP